jgi:hypothetical protein
MITDRLFVVDREQLGRRITYSDKFHINKDRTVAFGIIGWQLNAVSLELFTNSLSARIQRLEIEQDTPVMDEKAKEFYSAVTNDGKTSFLAMSRSNVYYVGKDDGIKLLDQEFPYGYGSGGKAYVFCKTIGVQDADAVDYISTVDLLVSKQYDVIKQTDLNVFYKPIEEVDAEVVESLKNAILQFKE